MGLMSVRWRTDVIYASVKDIGTIGAHSRSGTNYGPRISGSRKTDASMLPVQSL
jgi:hypothetical protein